ncbi:MAG: glycosyltransferase family 39 protein [Anaerolineaceae bacterium]
MTVVLPILGFLGLWIFSGNTRREPNWRAAFIQALILWFTWMVLSTELLSLFHAINRVGLSITWGTLVLSSVLWVIWWFKKGSVLRLPVIYRGRGRKVAILDVLLTLVILIPLVIGFIAPPNSSEAMDFGMARVAHWAQNESMAHFAAGNESLNSAPPGAGYAILNFYVLSGSDRWSNFPAWVALVGCIEAVMAIAGLFGSTPAGKRFAAIFATSIPTGLALASGALDDLPSVLWVTSFILIVYFTEEDKKLEFNYLLAALAAGLAFITKPVTLVFIAPFAIYFLVIQLKKHLRWKVLSGGFFGLLLIALLSAGFVGRNLATYSTGYDIDAYFADLNEDVGWKSTLSNVIRNFALHTNLPFRPANNWVKSRVIELHNQIGLDVNDPRTTAGGDFVIPLMNTSELTSGNPFHWMAIILVSVIVMILVAKKKQDGNKVIYLLLMFLSYLAFMVLLKWRPTGSRWHLTFFMMFAPLAGIVLDWIDSKRRFWGSALALSLLVLSVPWLVAVQERPILPVPGYTYPRSILTTSRESLYFSTEVADEPFYREIAQLVLSRPAVQKLGLVFEKPFLEYPIWAMTQNMEGHTKISYIWATGASKKYLNQEDDVNFILTDRCDNPESFPGFTLTMESGLDKCLYTKTINP